MARLDSAIVVKAMAALIDFEKQPRARA